MTDMVKRCGCITSRKPQTTRHKLLGIKTTPNTQYIYVDTPGLHQGQKKAINRYMNRAVTTAIQDVDVILFMIEKLQWLPEDELVAKRLAEIKRPVILVINKVDTIDDKETLLPHMQKMLDLLDVQEIIPVSALQNQNLDRLEEIIRDRLPENDHFFPEDQITDRSSRFLAAEIIREKITRQLGDELPYQMTVEKIMLKTWVKVKSGWSDDERALRSLGYDDS